MTTEPKNELLPCPFCDSGTYDKMGYDYGKVACDGSDCPISGIAMRPEQWNTRPAKAVQGDIERLANFILKSDLGHPRCSEQKPNGESAVDAAIAIITELRNKNALTPESEGIAGKGEFQ